MSQGKTFRDLRLSKGYTQESLAQELGVAVKTVCRWDRGEGSPSFPMFLKLKKLFGKDIESINLQTKGA